MRQLLVTISMQLQLSCPHYTNYWYSTMNADMERLRPLYVP
jgi:hypothetical protein